MDTTSEFWNWFKENNKAYTFLDSVDEEVKEQLMDKLLDQLHKYCDKLYFEIGDLPEEIQELIITAEGNKDYFDRVEKLVNSAPKINGWRFIAFKPAISEHFKSEWDDLSLNTEELWFLPILNKNSSHLSIKLFFPNYDLMRDNEILIPFLYKMLDTIVGEKSFALDIDRVEMDLLPDDPEGEGLYPILKLPEYLKLYKSKDAKLKR